MTEIIRTSSFLLILSIPSTFSFPFFIDYVNLRSRLLSSSVILSILSGFYFWTVYRNGIANRCLVGSLITKVFTLYYLLPSLISYIICNSLRRVVYQFREEDDISR